MADRTAGQRDEEGVRRFVERLAMMLTEWGFPRMPARVLGSMMTADEDSLTAADLAERLGVIAAAGTEATPAGVKIAEMRDFLRFLEAEMPRLLDKWHEVRSAEASG